MGRHLAAVAAAVAAVGLLVALPGVPSVAAHGAMVPREIDTRVLLDDEGLIDFGGCVGEQCAVDPHPGLDLLSLDAREMRLPDGRPAIAFAVTFQWQAEGTDGRFIRMQLTAGGQQQVVTFLGPDTATPTVAGAEKVVGPLPVGDGHPRLIEAWFALPTLGLAPGLEAGNITVQSFHGDTLDDAMPGGWYRDGVQVPHVPHSADPEEATEEHPPGMYAMKGPAPLLDVATPQADLTAFPRAYAVTVRNPLANLSQFVDLAAVLSPPGVATLDKAGLSLQPGESRTVNLTAVAGASGRANLTLASDLGGWASFDLPFIAPPATNSPDSTSSAPAKDSPAAAWVAAPILLLALAVARRRRP